MKKANAITVWIMTQETIKAGFTREQCESRLKAIFERRESLPMEENHCNPVEINIKPEFKQAAIQKWVNITGDSNRVIVVNVHKPHYDKFNTFYEN